MGKFLDKLLARTDPRPYAMADLSVGDHDPLDEDSPKGKIYDPHFVPVGGWDAWCEWAMEQGKIARITSSLAKNTMCGHLKGKDKDVQDIVDRMVRKTHLFTTLIGACHHWLGYGRTFLEPVWKTVGGQRVDLAAVRRLYPPSIRIFRDNENDVLDLKEFLKDIPRHAAYAGSLKAGLGHTIIGYAQYWEKRDKDEQKNGMVFFLPDELIYIPRYPSNRCPDGVSLLRQNYVLIMNKLGVERDQAIMAKRHGDPKHKFTIPHDLWHERENIKKDIRKGMRAGLDFFLKGRQRSDSPDPMNVDVVEPRGNPIAVIRAQEHLENQFIAAMCFADSFTESTSSNRSVGYIQLAFFEREIEPVRRIFAEVLEDQLIAPFLRAKGLSEDAAWFEFTDLTPEDRMQKLQIMAPLIPYMPATIVKQFLEEMGYNLDDGGDIDEEIRQIFAHRPVPLSSGNQDHLADVLKDMRDFLRSHPPITDLATQKGVPKPVLQAGRPAREQLKEEIERMREDIEDVLNL